MCRSAIAAERLRCRRRHRPSRCRPCPSRCRCRPHPRRCRHPAGRRTPGSARRLVPAAAASGFLFFFGSTWRWTGGGGGGSGAGGGTSVTSNTRVTLAGSMMSIFPDRFRNTNSNAAWIAATATSAPLLSRLLRFDRYISRRQRRKSEDGFPCATISGVRENAGRRQVRPAPRESINT